MKCLLGIDPEKTQKCKPSECASCGWEAAEAARRREYVKEHGLTLCADGFRRLIIKKENDMATPYKEGVIKDGNFKIAENNLLKAHFLNVALKHNMETRKFRPVKIEQRARIDGFVSVIDALTVRQKYYNEIGEMLKNAG